MQAYGYQEAIVDLNKCEDIAARRRLRSYITLLETTGTDRDNCNHEWVMDWDFTLGVYVRCAKCGKRGKE